MAPKSTTTGSPPLMRPGARMVAGLGRSSHRRRRSSRRRCFSAPPLPHGRVELKGEVLLADCPGSCSKDILGAGAVAASAMAAPTLHARDLGRILAPAQRLDGVGWSATSRSPPRTVGPLRCPLHETLPASPRPARQWRWRWRAPSVAARAACRCSVPAPMVISTSAPAPALLGLLGRLGAVAAIGREERQAARVTDQYGGRHPEPGEV